MLPPYCLSVPRMDEPMETLYGIEGKQSELGNDDILYTLCRTYHCIVLLTNAAQWQSTLADLAWLGINENIYVWVLAL